MAEKTDTDKQKDRQLGDEWEDWTGELDESKTYNETAGLFAIFAALAIILILSAIGFVLYMIEPRLALLHPVWVITARIITLVVILLTLLLSILIVSSVLTGKNLLIGTRLGQVAASRILPVALIIARRLGIPRDRLGNSFVAFSNAIIRSKRKPVKGKTIVLIPRCLNAETKKEVRELCDRAGLGVFSATGGGQARKIIRNERPDAVIGVACERDLISGIRDVVPKIPTLGVTNKRPEGPCKNTIIDMDELKRAIKTLTGAALE
ncbi:MAG: DUF116 domain-containing protein [Candidatus Latescibacteria bacterium]|nr:DUF116 domain-containing protein [Candidatus Latescibacterota bacterium]